VIEDTLAPGQAKLWVFAAGKDRCVFNWYSALIEIAIQNPRLELAACKLSFMHQKMERMLVVIALFANGVKASDELGSRKQRQCFVYHGSHSLNSMPS
jgi:hypothetical protein